MSCPRLGLCCQFALLFLAGCRFGPATGEVSGRVTFKGQPVTEGTLTFFEPKTGQVAEASLDGEGNYAVPGRMVVGEYVVTIVPGMYLDNSDPRTPPALTEKKAPNIPKKYRSQTTTPLRAPVKEGKNDFPFDLQP